MRLHEYVFLCLFASMFLLIAIKPMYSSAGYNPLTDEVKVHDPEYQEHGLPDHIRVHEDVHRRQWWAVILMLITALATMLGFTYNAWYTKHAYLIYVLLSVAVESMAYALTPISIEGRLTYIAVIVVLGIGNLAFWNYFFRQTDIGRGVGWRDLPLAPIAAILFWLV